MHFGVKPRRMRAIVSIAILLAILAGCASSLTQRMTVANTPIAYTTLRLPGGAFQVVAQIDAARFLPDIDREAQILALATEQVMIDTCGAMHAGRTVFFRGRAQGRPSAELIFECVAKPVPEMPPQPRVEPERRT